MSIRSRGRSAPHPIDDRAVGRRANNAVSHGRCLTSALVRENPQLRRHEVITGRHTMYCPPFTVRVDPVMKPASSVARKTIISGLPLPAQPVDATQALNLSAGVSNCKVSRGRSFVHALW